MLTMGKVDVRNTWYHSPTIPQIKAVLQSKVHFQNTFVPLNEHAAINTAQISLFAL